MTGDHCGLTKVAMATTRPAMAAPSAHPPDPGAAGGAEHPACGRCGEGEHQQQGGLVDRALHGHGVAGDGDAAGEDAFAQGGVARPERRAGG